MISRVPIMDTKTGDEAILQYDDNPDQRAVLYGVIDGSEALQAKLKKYFNKKRKFNIPETDVIDDYRVDTAKPVENITYFELSLCTMYRMIGVKMDKFLNVKAE